MNDSKARLAATPAQQPNERGRPHRVSRRRRALRWLVAITATVLLVAAVLQTTPWPSALLIRAVFEQGGAQTTAGMLPYVPTHGVDDLGDHQYGSGSADTTMAVYSASGSNPLPTIVWVHGGAWISGHREDVEPYLQILAAEGYTTVAVDYTVGPEATYPTAIDQVNEALAYLMTHAEELRIDPDRIVLAGDSAGAQIASQLTVLSTNAEYSDLIGIEPSLEPDQIAGVILNCGVYDLRRMADLTGITSWGFKTALWAYTGTKDWSATYAGATMSTIDFVTGDFPPAFISGGNGDGLTWLQSVPMSQRLKDQDVAVTEVFWPETHEPALPHEYQFHLDTDEAQLALQETIGFLRTVTG